MTLPEDLTPVIDSGLCIGCGACTAADRSIELIIDPVKQMYEPSHPGGPEAAAVCPAVQVDFAELQRRVFPGQESTVHGVVEDVFLAQSTDHDRNVKSSSGGLIKELILDLLAREEVDGVIALKEVEGLRFEPAMITGLEEVDQLPGSIYHNLDLSGALRLLEDTDGRFVLVAIPCQLEGIYNYIQLQAPHLMDRIHTTIGLLCGWLYSHHAIKAICEFKGIDFERIQQVSYRGGGPVGPLRIVTPDGEKRISRRVDFSYQVAFDRSFNTPRCHLCVNHSNFLADIVVGDAWLPSTLTTKTGISLLICRKTATSDLVRSLSERARVNVTEVTVEEITESQTHRVVFGDFAYAYADYRRELGLHTPEMIGPNYPEARKSSRGEVARFHRELERKLALQRAGRYRRLWWRKATLELRRFALRYLRWFFVRVLRVKSLFGKRQEISREQTGIFR
jgi:coenzyme F420-reducing hydrogenase beta subunit